MQSSETSTTYTLSRKRKILKLPRLEGRGVTTSDREWQTSRGNGQMVGMGVRVSVLGFGYGLRAIA